MVSAGRLTESVSLTQHVSGSLPASVLVPLRSTGWVWVHTVCHQVCVCDHLLTIQQDLSSSQSICSQLEPSLLTTCTLQLKPCNTFYSPPTCSICFVFLCNTHPMKHYLITSSMQAKEGFWNLLTIIFLSAPFILLKIFRICFMEDGSNSFTAAHC